MKWILCIVLLFCHTQVFSQANSGRHLVTIYIDEAYPPYTYIEKGRLTGIYVDRLTEIFEYLDSFYVELKPVPWQRGKKIMEEGKGLALTPPYFHAHDWPYLYPYSLSYGEEVIGVVCQNSAVPIDPKKWPEHYIKFSFASVIGYDGWGGDAFRDMVAKKQIMYTEVASNWLLLQMILNGRVDCILAELNAFKTKLEPLKASHDVSGFRIVTEIGRDEVYVGFSEPAMNSGEFPYARQFQRELDIAIYQWRKANPEEASRLSH